MELKIKINSSNELPEKEGHYQCLIEKDGKTKHWITTYFSGGQFALPIVHSCKYELIGWTKLPIEDIENQVHEDKEVEVIKQLLPLLTNECLKDMEGNVLNEIKDRIEKKRVQDEETLVRMQITINNIVSNLLNKQPRAIPKETYTFKWLDVIILRLYILLYTEIQNEIKKRTKQAKDKTNGVNGN